MKLSDFDGVNVEVTDVDGHVFSGCVTDYICAEDNEPEGESIILKTCNGVYRVQKRRNQQN